MNRQAYRNGVWLILHSNSDSGHAQTAALQLYMDESGGDDPSTPHAVVGGMLVYRDGYLEFEPAWDEMLNQHGVYGIHMKEFGRPHGRLAYLCDEQREALFTDACALIRKYRAVTIAATLSNEKFKANVPQEARDTFGVYGMCFALAAWMNGLLAKHNDYRDPIPVMLDEGNPYKHHVLESHAYLYKSFQAEVEYINLGPLAFGDDTLLNVLQAADLIAWGVRRMESNVSFRGGFEPIETLLTTDDAHHVTHAWSDEVLQGLGTNLARIIAQARKEKQNGAKR